MTTIDTKQFKETPVIQSLKHVLRMSNEVVTSQQPNKRGRKNKYQTDEERIAARRAQQKAYRDRRKQELLELRAMRDRLSNKE